MLVPELGYRGETQPSGKLRLVGRKGVYRPVSVSSEHNFDALKKFVIFAQSFGCVRWDQPKGREFTKTLTRRGRAEGGESGAFAELKGLQEKFVIDAPAWSRFKCAFDGLRNVSFGLNAQPHFPDFAQFCALNRRREQLLRDELIPIACEGCRAANDTGAGEALFLP
jgi:hypothetical protein